MKKLNIVVSLTICGWFSNTITLYIFNMTSYLLCRIKLFKIFLLNFTLQVGILPLVSNVPPILVTLMELVLTLALITTLVAVHLVLQVELYFITA